MPMPEDVRITDGLAVLAALLLSMAIWWLWWRLPKREVARLALKIRDPKARADVEDTFRKTVGQGLGGIAVLLGAGLAYLQFLQQQRASHDLLISNQVSKGFEQLGSEKLVVRLGGIYALEGVMNNSDQYHQAVLEGLSAFVREGAKPPTTPLTPGPPTLGPPTDIQAALTVIGRRSDGPGIADLTNANIAGAILGGAGLRGAILGSADLTGAFLLRADLTGAFLNGADLTRASLGSAKLGSADLTGAKLGGAILSSADLTGANLTDANLTNAYLGDANLTFVYLTNADLTFAHLNGADLTHANLTGARLLGQKQLDEACGSDAVLPQGLTLKPCPPQSTP
jgi:uncharacterized protein YjbI with pentapeptide repeats